MNPQFDAHSHDRGQVYQQASGMQFNAENIYIDRSLEQLLPGLENVADWPKVRELDALELRVHRSVVEGGSAIPPYIGRDADVEIGHRLDGLKESRGGFVILVGDSTSGKSRAAYEATQQAFPDAHISNPDDESQLQQALLAAFVSTEQCVIWLDDLDRFLGPDSATPRLFSRLRGRDVMVISTMRIEPYNALTELSAGSNGADAHGHALTATGHLLQEADPVLIQRMWSSTELQRAAESDDARVSAAVAHASTYGVAEYLAAGPKLLHEWRIAQSAGGSPRGAALVRAAIDVARGGLTGPVRVELLVDAHAHYLEQAGGALLRPESVERAISWATRRRYGVTSLLLPTNLADHYRVFDYLLDASSREDSDPPPIPQETWDLIVEEAKDDRIVTLKIAVSAHRAGRDDISEIVLSRAAQSGDGSAAADLARFYRACRRLPDAEQWYRIATDRGDVESNISLGLILQKRGDLNGAETAYRAAASVGDTHAAYHLGDALQQIGNVVEAEYWYRKAADAQAKAAISGLAQLMIELDRADEAESWLRSIALDSTEAANALANILDDRGEEAEAVEWWTSSADRGGMTAALNLGRWHFRNGNLNDAEVYARLAYKADVTESAALLGKILANTDRTEEAESVLQSGVQDGQASAAVSLAEMQANRGRKQESIQLLRDALEMDTSNRGGVLFLLGMLLVEGGAADEGALRLEEALHFGAYGAAVPLANLAMEAGDDGKARDLYKQGAEGGDAYAACLYARILCGEDNFEEAETFLAQSLKAGHTHAGCNLGVIQWVSGRHEDARRSFIAAFDGGHPHAAEVFSNHLAAAGNGKEASDWLRRSRGVSVNSGPRNRSKKRGRRGRR